MLSNTIPIRGHATHHFGLVTLLYTCKVVQHFQIFDTLLILPKLNGTLHLIYTPCPLICVTWFKAWYTNSKNILLLQWHSVQVWISALEVTNCGCVQLKHNLGWDKSQLMLYSEAKNKLQELSSLSGWDGEQGVGEGRRDGRKDVNISR